MTVLKEIKRTINNWWIYLLLGVLFIIGSFYVYSLPGESYITLSLFFAAFILVDGIGSIILAVSNSKNMEGWGWQLTGGIISALIGFGLFIHPGLSMAILPVFIGFWILMKGMLVTGTSFDLKSHGVKGWGWILVLGIINILLGLMMIINPVFGASMVLIFTAIALLTLGISMIAVSLRLRTIKRKVTKLKENSKEKLEELKTSLENYLKEESVDMQTTLTQIKEKLEEALSKR